MTSFLKKALPVLDTDSICFKITYSIVALALVGLLATALVTGKAVYLYLAVGLVVSAWAGQVAPLYPVGIVSMFVVVSLVVGNIAPR
jgi:hypothetical protein